MSEPAIEEFERAYAERSGTTVEFLHAWGRFGAPCDCGDETCEGFQMMHLRDKLLAAGWEPPGWWEPPGVPHSRVEGPYHGHPEFVPLWDVYRDDAGNAVTIDCGYGHYEGAPLTEVQLEAARHAVRVWRLVCAAEGSHQTERTLHDDGTLDWQSANVAKSRLLWRLIHEGLPPTRTKPPIETGGPAWWLLPGGDPFAP